MFASTLARSQLYIFIACYGATTPEAMNCISYIVLYVSLKNVLAVKIDYIVVSNEPRKYAILAEIKQLYEPTLGLYAIHKPLPLVLRPLAFVSRDL